MRKTEVKLPLTPITEQTFKRQGWTKHKFSTQSISNDDDYEDGDDPSPQSEGDSYFFMLPIPKNREDKYAPCFVSNASNEVEILKEIGLIPGTYFIEILNMDGLGYCDNEEDLEILYRALTGDDINIK